MRKYVSVKPRMDEYYEANAADSLARTVYENIDLVDIGVLDAEGNPVMAYEKMQPIGFVHHKK